MSASGPGPCDALSAAVLRTAPTWGMAALATALASWSLASAGQALPLVHAVGWLVVGLVLVPLSFALGLAAAAAVLTVLLTTISLPWLVRRRATGLGELLGEVWWLAGSVLPGFWRALRRVRRPGLWGAVAGLCVGTFGYVLVHGCHVPAATG